MIEKYYSNKGFSLIEVIASMVIMGIIGAIAGMGLVQITEGFLFSKKTTTTAQKGQIVMSRLVKEFRSITSIPASPTPTEFSITYSRNPADPTDTHTVSSTGGTGPLIMDGDILTDQVKSFRFNYYKTYDDTSDPATYSSSTKMIEIKLELESVNGASTTYVNRVFLYKLIE